MESDEGFQIALGEAKKGAAEGGVPIGACLVAADGKVLGRGHNMRIQNGSATLHVCNTYHHISGLILIWSGRDSNSRERWTVTRFFL